ncbi:hypothetical protein JCM8208_000349 [Rhodotorula glutinis]
MGRTRSAASSAPLGRSLPKRARLVTARFDPGAIAAAPQTASERRATTTTKHKVKVKPKPKPVARQTVKTMAGISRDSGGTTTSGQSATLRAKVLAAVVRLSREKKRGMRGVGHSSVNTYLAKHAPATSPTSMVKSFSDLVLEAKQQLVKDGILRPGEGAGTVLAAAPGVSQSVMELCDISNPNSSDDERACTTFLSSAGKQRRSGSSKTVLKPHTSSVLQPEVVIAVPTSSPLSSRPSSSAAKKRRASTASIDARTASELDTLTESDNLESPSRSRKLTRQKKKVRIVTPSEQDDDESTTDAQGESDDEQDGDVNSGDEDEAMGSTITAGEGKTGKGLVVKGRTSGNLGRLTKLQLVAIVKELRAEVKERDGELGEAHEQIEALGESAREWEVRARVLGWEDEPVQGGEGGAEGGDGEGVVEQEEVGEEVGEGEFGGSAPAQEVKAQLEPVSGLDGTASNDHTGLNVDKEVVVQASSTDNKLEGQHSSALPATPVKHAAAHDYDASTDADLLIDDDAFDAELRRAGWPTPSVPAAAARASSDSSSTEPSPPAPRPFAGAPLPFPVPIPETTMTAPEPSRSASAPPAPRSSPSAREQARLTMQNGASTTVMTVLVDSPSSQHLLGATASSSAAVGGRTSVEPEKQAVVPRRSSLPTDAVLRASPASSSHRAPGGIFARFGGECTSGAASSSSSASSAAKVEKEFVGGGQGGAASAARVAGLETERDGVKEKEKEVEGELEKARAENAALKEDVGGILSRHHEIVTELSKQKLQLEATVGALEGELGVLKTSTAQQEHELQQQLKEILDLETNREEVHSLVLRHALHHAKQAGSPIQWASSGTLSHAQLVPLLDSLLRCLHARGQDVARLERERNSCSGLVAGLLRSCRDIGDAVLASPAAHNSGGGGAGSVGSNLEAAVQLVVRIVEHLVAELGTERSALEQASQQVTEYSHLVTSSTDALVGVYGTLASSLGPLMSFDKTAPQHLPGLVKDMPALALCVSRRVETSQGIAAQSQNELRTVKSALEKANSQLQVETSRVAVLATEKEKLSERVAKLEGIRDSFMASLDKLGLLSRA